MKYYPAGSVRTSLYGLIAVSGGATQDGKIDYDQAGKLVGNWVLAGHQYVEDPAYTLAFTYNVFNHDFRVSIGGTLAGTGGDFGIQSGAPDFASVTPATGQVDYQLFPTGSGDDGSPGAQTELISVQMLSDTQIKAEVFVGSSLTTGTFDANAQIYER